MGSAFGPPAPSLNIDYPKLELARAFIINTLYTAARNHDAGRQIEFFQIIYDFVNKCIALEGFSGIKETIITEYEFLLCGSISDLLRIASPRLNDVLNKLYKAETLARENGHVFSPGSKPEHPDAST